MLLNLHQYHRPVSANPADGLKLALDLLVRPGCHTVPLVKPLPNSFVAR